MWRNSIVSFKYQSQRSCFCVSVCSVLTTQRQYFLQYENKRDEFESCKNSCFCRSFKQEIVDEAKKVKGHLLRYITSVRFRVVVELEPLPATQEGEG